MSRRDQGLTVVELLVAATIFLVLLGGLGALLASSGRGYRVNAEHSEAMQDSEAVLQLLRYELGLAGYRGLGAGDPDRPFTLDGVGEQATISVERTADGDRVTVRYFEDRHIEGGDSGERSVTYSVRTSDNTLLRSERHPMRDPSLNEIMVGNVSSLVVESVVDLQRNPTSITQILANPTSKPGVIAGMILRIGFVNGDEWELLLGFSNAQDVEIL